MKISHSLFIYGNSDSTYFDKMFPILIGLCFLFVFLSGIALLRERTIGTLERVYYQLVVTGQVKSFLVI